jgi:hypothetical protein
MVSYFGMSPLSSWGSRASAGTTPMLGGTAGRPTRRTRFSRLPRLPALVRRPSTPWRSIQALARASCAAYCRVISIWSRGQ